MRCCAHMHDSVGLDALATSLPRQNSLVILHVCSEGQDSRADIGSIQQYIKLQQLTNQPMPRLPGCSLLFSTAPFRGSERSIEFVRCKTLTGRWFGLVSWHACMHACQYMMVQFFFPSLYVQQALSNCIKQLVQCAIMHATLCVVSACVTKLLHVYIWTNCGNCIKQCSVPS